MKLSPTAALAAAILGAAMTSPTHALNIVPTFINNPSYGTFGTWNATEEQVVNQAITDWENRIRDNQTINVTFDFTNVPSGYLAQWNGNYSGVPAGTNIYPWTQGVTHTININTYWLNPPAGNNNFFYFTTGSVPANDWDALSTLRHELGHAMGFVPNFYDDNIVISPVDKWTSHIVGTTFDPGGLNVTMESDLEHTANTGVTANDLMNAQLVNGIRRGISTTDLQLLEKAYHYAMIPGDTNRDGVVNLSDLLTLTRNFGSTGGSWDTGDFNGDGTVNLQDFLALTRDFGKTIATYSFPQQITAAVMPALASASATGASAAVSADLLVVQTPEPAALGTLAIAALAMLRRRRSI